MTLRYMMVNQLHYLGEAAGKPTVVTMQRWDALRAAARRSDHVILNDGVIVVSERYVSSADLARMDATFAAAKARYGRVELTEDQARDLIELRTGVRPPQEYCGSRPCGARVPLGACRCGAGHTFNQTGSGSGHGVPAGRDIVMAPRGGVF